MGHKYREESVDCTMREGSKGATGSTAPN